MKEILLAPSLAELMIEDHYRSVVRDSHKDKYRTARWQNIHLRFKYVMFLGFLISGV